MRREGEKQRVSTENEKRGREAKTEERSRE